MDCFIEDNLIRNAQFSLINRSYSSNFFKCKNCVKNRLSVCRCLANGQNKKTQQSMKNEKSSAEPMRDIESKSIFGVTMWIISRVFAL